VPSLLGQPDIAADARREPAGGRWAVLPGLALVALLTGAAWLLVDVPGLHLLGALALALVLGVVARTVLGPRLWLAPGARFAAKRLLRLGVVLLGVRLQLDLLVAAGPTALVLACAAVLVCLAAMEPLGRLLGVAPGLRRTLAVGTGVCGASAIAAAAPVVQADDDEAAMAVGLVSLLGAAGVVAFSLLAEPLGLGERAYALVVGATLHEVGHVLAAGAAMGPTALDLATLVKLVRVAMLAPALLLLGLLARAPVGAANQAPSGALKGRALLPGFLVGFLLLGAARSAGVVPSAWVAPLSTSSLLLTAAAMAGIGLGVDLAGIRRAGGRALLLAVVGFLASLLVAGLIVLLAG
jgi:uncharacterized integral membrane protein (TIGR00698 family)